MRNESATKALLSEINWKDAPICLKRSPQITRHPKQFTGFRINLQWTRHPLTKAVMKLKDQTYITKAGLKWATKQRTFVLSSNDTEFGNIWCTKDEAEDTVYELSGIYDDGTVTSKEKEMRKVINDLLLEKIFRKVNLKANKFRVVCMFNRNKIDIFRYGMKTVWQVKVIVYIHGAKLICIHNHARYSSRCPKAAESLSKMPHYVKLL